MVWPDEDRGACPPPPPITWAGGELRFDRGTLVMGIINVTPDSFSGDGIGADPAAAARQAASFAAAGSHLVDVGGESTRPGSEPVSVEEEIDRVVPAIRAIRERVPLPISVDTSKAEVAEAALEAGAQIVNDVTALRGDPDMASVVARAGVPVVLMHMLGTPKTMQDNPWYDDVIGEIRAFLAERIDAAVNAGIRRDRIIVDPGIGFGKRLEDNLEILRRLREFRSLGRPILIGTSRKSVIAGVLHLPPDQRVEGTAATVACAILHGASIVRVHDVEPMVRVARMTDAIVRGSA
jgi:dihydropteroate synthase